jgi:hypothetical protein
MGLKQLKIIDDQHHAIESAYLELQRMINSASLSVIHKDHPAVYYALAYWIEFLGKARNARVGG